jgi:hypothetical protein
MHGHGCPYTPGVRGSTAKIIGSADPCIFRAKWQVIDKSSARFQGGKFLTSAFVCLFDAWTVCSLKNIS